MKEFKRQDLPYVETSRITDTISLLKQATSFEDVEQKEAFCIRAALSLLFGADVIAESMVIGKDNREILIDLAFTIMESRGLWILPAETPSHFLEQMSKKETHGALIVTTIKKLHDHAIGIIPSKEDGLFLIVDTSKKPYIREIDELGLIDSYVDADSPFPQKNGLRSVFVFTSRDLALEKLLPELNRTSEN